MRNSVNDPREGNRRKRAARLTVDAFTQFRAGLHRFLLRRLRGSQDVEDLAHEVYLRLLRSGGSAPVKYPQAYVYRVALNVLYEFKFHRKHGVVTFDSETLAGVLNGLEDPADAPDELYERSHLEDRLGAAVAQLSPMQRAVFLLAKHQDLSHTQIAERLGISVNTARVHLHRAICHCRQALGKEAQGSPMDGGDTP